MNAAHGRKIPLTIIDTRKVVAEETLADAHAHEDEGQRSIGRPPPCFLFVADTPIDEAGIAQEMQHHRDFDPKRARRAAAEALVVRELLRLEAARLGLEDSIECVDGETREEAAIRLLIEREMPVAETGTQACRHWYEQNRGRLREPDTLRLRHILLAAAPDDIEERLRGRERGEDLIAQLRSHPERFTEFAMRYSACPSREDGGALGWIARGDTVPEFERQVFMLAVGLAGLTVETRYGHHVVWVDEIARGAALSFEKAEARIAAYLETQAKQNAISQYISLLSQRYGVRGMEHFDS